MDIETQILKALHMENAPTDMQQEVVRDVQAIIESRLMLMVDEMLTDEQRATFEKVQEEEGIVEARMWLEQNVINTQELYVALLADYLAEKQIARR